MATALSTSRAPARPPRPQAAPPQRRLQVVGDSRRALRFGVLLGVALFLVMFGVTAFQTKLAENQLQIDRTEAQIAEQRELYDQLRLQSATLRSPERLTTEAKALGMQPAGPVEFVPVDPAAVSAVAVSTADLDDAQALPAPDPLDEYGAVKRGVDGTP
jgi:cell division protein FtsL